DYGFLAPAGEYEVVMDSDARCFGGFGHVEDRMHHFTQDDPLYSPSGKGWLKLYIPARSAQVLRMIKPKPRRKTVKKEEKTVVADSTAAKAGAKTASNPGRKKKAE
ncbi:MAG: alpha amylase C-terminal domain-containing protein, partial [Muribaculaceae bacterium]|nr:alpha amylase C-terminal domain-containing protein [Muribaculaceae bacterium]